MRLATGIVATILLWLSTGGVLKHTDDLSAFRMFPGSAAQSTVIQHGVAVTPAGDDDCAACRWAVTSSTLVIVPVFVTASATMHLECPQALPAPVRTAPILHAHFRAPPAAIV
jgi:hypothetical protein